MESVSGSYNLWLVALSFVVAILTSYTAVDLAGRVTANRGRSRAAWLTGGAIAMGSGIWCMHYIGMLAFQMSVPVRYYIPTVGLSLLAAILASFTTLHVVSREDMTKRNAAIGSLIMGVGIAEMHYIGMSAMRLNAMHEYHVGLWLASVVLAVVISFVGIILIFQVRGEGGGFRKRFLTSIVLGLAIPVMHYTGMSAVTFRAMPNGMDLANSVDISSLALFAIFGVTGVILSFALLTSLVDRRLAEQDAVMKTEREMLRALIDHIPDRMYVKDVEGRFVLANMELAKEMGFEDPRMLIGKRDSDFYPADLASKFERDEQRVMLSGLPLFEHEEIGLNKSGKQIPLLTTKVPLRSGHGVVTGIAGIGRNISERKESERALFEAERKYRMMFDEALVGIFKLDANGHLLQVNPAMAELLGYADQQDMFENLTGSLWARIVSQERREQLLAAMEPAGHVRAFEVELARKDGVHIWVTSSVRQKHQSGAIEEYVGIFEDITERRLLREKLLQAQKLESVGQLAAGIAHEINTPVQYINDNVRFLKESFEQLSDLNDAYARLLTAAEEDAVLPQVAKDTRRATEDADIEYLIEEIPRAIDQTIEGITRVADLVGAMKDFSHPGTREKVVVDLNRAISSTTTVAKNEWKYVADLTLDLEQGLPSVLGLPGELNQVVLNLVVNAAHAIAGKSEDRKEKKGSIIITTRAVTDFVEMRVQDNGGGIPEAIRTRIFDPFFTTKEIGKGTGQGLAIARSVIVDKHQGSIDFESVEGHGTTFIIRLPCEVASSRTIDTEAA